MWINIVQQKNNVVELIDSFLAPAIGLARHPGSSSVYIVEGMLGCAAKLAALMRGLRAIQIQCHVLLLYLKLSQEC